MFRVQKSEGMIEHRDSEGDDANLGASADEQEGSVTSSALRWLRGSGKPDDNASSPRRRLSGAAALARAKIAEEGEDEAPGDHADELELTEELELTKPIQSEEPLRPIVASREQPEQDLPDTPALVARPADPPETHQTLLTLHTQPPEITLPLDAFDDDDDIDDFDDLGDLEAMLPPTRFKPVERLPAIDLSEFPPVSTVVLPPEPTAEIKTQHAASVQVLPDTGAPVLMPRTVDERPSKQATPSREEPSPKAPRPSEITLEDQTIEAEVDTKDTALTVQATPSVVPVSSGDEHIDELPKLTLRKASLEQHVPSQKAKEATTKTKTNLLALQPIPELQSSSKQPRAEAPALRPTPPVEDLPAVIADIEDDKYAITANAPGDPDMLPAPQGLAVIDELESVEDDRNNVSGPDDWHAQLADALSITPKDNAADAESGDESMDGDRSQDELSQIVPLSSTLSDLAVETEPARDADGDDVLVPPLAPTLPQDRSIMAAPSQAATRVVPDLPVTLSTEQTAIAIIAQVPRLRRFAAAQIGDEEEADRLVGATIQAMLTDPSMLEQADDKNLAMLMMLCRRRQSDLSGAAETARSASSAKAFQTTLCEKLVGADQFEIHQFAQAINLVDEQDRTLLLLAALEGLSYEQIAVMIQRPVGQVMLRLSEARMGLRQALAVEEGKEHLLAEAHPREIEIHGYLDGELDQRHMADMDSLVEHDLDAADRLLHYGIQGDLIRRIYAPLLNRPIPQELLAALSTAFSAKRQGPAKRGFFRSARLALFTGAIVMAVCAGIMTWMMPTLASAVSDAMTTSSLNVISVPDDQGVQDLAVAAIQEP